MVKLKILETVSRQGSEGKPNEDRFGSNTHCAFVIDGATGLGDQEYVPDQPSDAAWFAGFPTRYLEKYLEAGSVPVSLFAEMISQAQKVFVNYLDGGPAPRYSWPSASIAMLKATAEGFYFIGLGDCTAYVKSDEKPVEVYTALDQLGRWENDQALHHVKRVGGISGADMLDDGQTLEYLREIRSHHNTEESDVWTLGLVEEAAQNLRQELITMKKSGAALICSDGFSSLAETYNRYTPEQLLEKALSRGLGSLIGELQHIEDDEDPRAIIYPRFKRSDDATAVLVELSA